MRNADPRRKPAAQSPNVGACTLNESNKTYRRIMADKRLWMGELRAGRQADPFAMCFVLSFPRRNGVRILPDKQTYAASAPPHIRDRKKSGEGSECLTVVASPLCV